MFEDALRRHLLQRQPTPLSVMRWVVTGRWLARGVQVDIAFVPQASAPVI
ncbi:MAG: hypothetical protein QOJ56_5136 [Mycobacterium sp.]|nr:hypothetical protein [Mycobacterium sp.]